MKQHSRAYEQYCYVKQKNIVFEETVYHNGTKSVHCTSFDACSQTGGCRNHSLCVMCNKIMPLNESFLRNIED